MSARKCPVVNCGSNVCGFCQYAAEHGKPPSSCYLRAIVQKFTPWDGGQLCDYRELNESWQVCDGALHHVCLCDSEEIAALVCASINATDAEREIASNARLLAAQCDRAMEVEARALKAERELAEARTALGAVDAVGIVAHLSTSIRDGASLAAWIKRVLAERDAALAQLAEAKRDNKVCQEIMSDLSRQRDAAWEGRGKAERDLAEARRDLDTAYAEITRLRGECNRLVMGDACRDGTRRDSVCRCGMQERKQMTEHRRKPA